MNLRVLTTTAESLMVNSMPIKSIADLHATHKALLRCKVDAGGVDEGGAINRKLGISTR